MVKVLKCGTGHGDGGDRANWESPKLAKPASAYPCEKALRQLTEESPRLGWPESGPAFRISEASFRLAVFIHALRLRDRPHDGYLVSGGCLTLSVKKVSCGGPWRRRHGTGGDGYRHW